MNSKKSVMMISLLFSGILLSSMVLEARTSTIRVLVITGGHDYEHLSFMEMFESMSGTISFKVAELPEAFTLFQPEHRDEYDVIVFYHMWQTITKEQELEISDCIRQGKALVVLHHSICAFDDWDEYRRILGGKYFHRSDTVNGEILPVSSYTHDVSVNIQIKSINHPVTKGMADFELWDEIYDDFYVEPGITPLLTTNNTGSSPIIGWTKTYGKARVVVLQPGHDAPTFRNLQYRKLLKQAIEWVYLGGNPNQQ
jgi:type 1 glutamine amidotransferase